MKDRIEETILHLNQKVLFVISSITGSITILDAVDFGTKMILFVISAGAGILAWKNYKLKNEKLKKEKELLDQQIYAQIEENKKKGL